jgi:hypothetical protein
MNSTIFIIIKRIQLVHTRSKRIVVNMMDPRLRASPRHGGQELFSNFLVTDPPRGRPIGGGGIYHT